MEKIEKLLGYLADEPEDDFLRHALAMEYIKLGNDAKAKELLEAVLLHNPGYVGSYYHLGQLLERTGKPTEAENIYVKGMEICLEQNEKHAYNELRGAYEELTM